MSTLLLFLAFVSAVIFVGSLGWPALRKYRRLVRLRARPRYRKKSAFLTPVERDMLKALQDMVGPSMVVFPNIRIFDLIELSGGSEENNPQLAGRVRSEIIDFVVCDRQTSNPVLAVDLRNPSENDEHTLERQEFIEDTLRSAGVPMLPIARESPRSTLQFAESVHNALGDFIRKSSQAA